MTVPRDPDRMIRAFIAEGADRLPDPVYDALRSEIDMKRQRAVIGPWRIPDVSKIVPVALGAAAVVVVLVVGAQLIRPAQSGVTGAPAVTPSPTPTQTSPSPSGALGGVVTFTSDGAPATTEVHLTEEGPGVSGTAVTTFDSRHTHKVRLECSARDGDTWAVGGTTEETTVLGEDPGSWSAVIVKEGSPQKIAIWLSDAKQEGQDCARWLAAIDLASIEPGNFQPATSGELVPPPGASS